MEDETDDTKRKCRNLSEKKRRDQFNVLVNELSAIVSTSSRKMDKSTVLKATISFLKNHNEIAVRSRAHDIQEEWKPSFLSNEEFTHLLLEALDGFIMVFSATGHIHFASESITSLLGHLPADILHQSIFDLAYDEDRPSLYGLLQNPGTSVDIMQAVVLKENQIKFQCHIRRGTLDFREEPTYELVQFIGYFRSSLEPLEGERVADFSLGHDSRFLFVCTGQLLLPQLIRDMPPTESAHCEFTSQLSLEWKYLFLDHRAPPIIGYLPFEVLGTSGYDYYHLDDLDKVASCHDTLMQKGELTSCYYRFLTKGQQWIWLQTRFFISYHQWNSKPEFVVCTHRVVSYADVVEQVKCEREATVGGGGPLEGAQARPDVSMSPSYVSECSEDFDGRRMSQCSQKSMSLGSVCGSVTEPAPAEPAAGGGSRAPSSVSSVAPYEGPSAGHVVRSRYSSSEGSAPSVDMRLLRRRREGCGGGGGGGGGGESQGAIGAQYMEPAPYVVPVPVAVTPAHVQLQLQRKHEELQQMIAMQQQELRRIAEQLLMARLGVPPILNMRYDGDMTPNGVPQIIYDVRLGAPPPLPAPPYDEAPPHVPADRERSADNREHPHAQ